MWKNKIDSKCCQSNWSQRTGKFPPDCYEWSSRWKIPPGQLLLQWSPWSIHMDKWCYHQSCFEWRLAVGWRLVQSESFRPSNLYLELKRQPVFWKSTIFWFLKISPIFVGSQIFHCKIYQNIVTSTFRHTYLLICISLQLLN